MATTRAITRRKVLASGAALGALAASGQVFAPAIAQNKPLRIGILAPRSGIAAAPGESGIRATQWAVEHFNAAGGIAGRKVELVIEEESSPKDTIERFSKLVQQDKVDCVQGIISTGVGLALGPVVEEAAGADDLLGRHHAGRRRREDAEPALPLPLHRQRVRGGDGLAARDQALEGQVRDRRRHQPRLLVRPQQLGGVHRAAEELQHRAQGRHRAVAEGRHAWTSPATSRRSRRRSPT